MSRMRLIGVRYDVEPDPAQGPVPPIVTPTPRDSGTPDYHEVQPDPGTIVIDDSADDPEGTPSSTLPVAPTYALPIRVRIAQAQRFEAEQGDVWAYGRATVGRREFEAVWAALSAADYATLSAFFVAQGTTAFSWTPAGESAGYYAVVGDVVERLVGPSVWRVEATLRESGL